MVAKDASKLALALREETIDLIVAATGQDTLPKALLWIAEGRKLKVQPSYLLTRALVEMTQKGVAHAADALRAVSRLSLRSEIDTAATLVNVDSILTPAECDGALEALATLTPGRRLQSTTTASLLSVLETHPRVVEVYAQLGGLSWRDLRDRARRSGTSLPTHSNGAWSSAQMRQVVAIVDDVISAHRVGGSGFVQAQPIEVLTGAEDKSGWDIVESAHRDGVSLGHMLAQRTNGSSWGAHKNSTNNAFRDVLITSILRELDNEQLSYWTTYTQAGSGVGKSFLEEKIQDGTASLGSLSIVTHTPKGTSALAIFVAIAHDGGSARKTASTLAAIPAGLTAPAAIVVGGQGWSERSESDKLIVAFNGQVFTDIRLDELIELAKASNETALKRERHHTHVTASN